jgi:hypothetical protein
VFDVPTDQRIRGALPVIGATAVSVAAGGLLLGVEGRVGIVMKAAGIPKNATGLGGFVNGAHALVTPALVMVAAIAPLALIAGGLVLLFGGRRGMQIVGTSLGVLLLLGSVTALID